jgi:hypothetical protein
MENPTIFAAAMAKPPSWQRAFGTILTGRNPHLALTYPISNFHFPVIIGRLRWPLYAT